MYRLYISEFHFRIVKGTLQYICYKRVGRMDHCSQFFILFLNGITHQYFLPCDFAVPPTRVDGEYFRASLVWGLAMRLALANEMWTEMQMCQS